MDKAQYEVAVRGVADTLYRFACKLCKDGDDAKDIVQESFIRLWANREEVKEPRRFLFQTAYRLFLDTCRRGKVRQEYVDSCLRAGDATDRHPDFVFRNELKEALDRALEKLPPVQKAVVLLRDYEGYSYEEIGQITGLSEAQVKTYIFRARTALRKYIVEPARLLS